MSKLSLYVLRKGHLKECSILGQNEMKNRCKKIIDIRERMSIFLNKIARRDISKNSVKHSKGN